MTFSYLQSMGCKGFVTSFSGMITSQGNLTPPFVNDIDFSNEPVTLPTPMDPFTIDHEKEPFVDDVPGDLGDEPPAGESP